MKKAYWVCIFEIINNTEKLKDYAIKAKPAVEKFSGKFLARGGKSRTNEGIDSPRVVVVEFPAVHRIAPPTRVARVMNIYAPQSVSTQLAPSQ